MTMSDEELRRRVAGAYDDVLDEAIPARLSSLLAANNVTSIADRRARKTFAGLTWAQLGGIAAAIVMGIAVGWQLAPAGDSLVAERGGVLVAGTDLSHALQEQLASQPGKVAVQLSFTDRDGRYCRTFTARQVAGLACRDEGRWSIVATAEQRASARGEMRQAASGLPKAVLDAVDARIAGTPFDAVKEKEARDRGWAR